MYSFAFVWKGRDKVSFSSFNCGSHSLSSWELTFIRGLRQTESGPGLDRAPAHRHYHHHHHHHFHCHHNFHRHQLLPKATWKNQKILAPKKFRGSYAKFVIHFFNQSGLFTLYCRDTYVTVRKWDEKDKLFFMDKDLRRKKDGLFSAWFYF